MIAGLVAFDAAGNVIATLDYVVAKDNAGNVIGLVDIEAQERGDLRDIWDVQGATGSGTWPEWLGTRAHDFRAEVTAGRISALVHKTSGHRRERAAIEAAIAERIAAAGDEPADIRDLVGGPGRPLLLDDEGRTMARMPVQRPNLPIIGRSSESPRLDQRS